jgi:hypothetical protein
LCGTVVGLGVGYPETGAAGWLCGAVVGLGVGLVGFEDPAADPRGL